MVQPVTMATPHPEGLGQTAEEKTAAEAYLKHLETLPEALKAHDVAERATEKTVVPTE
jgi:hypothetical protein